MSNTLAQSPLLLADHNPVHLQIVSARCRRDEFDKLFVCRIDSWHLSDVPDWVYTLGVVGLIEIEGASYNQLMSGEFGEHTTSWILFRDKEGFRLAWSIARRLAKATQGNPALIYPSERQGVLFMQLCERHFDALAPFAA